MRCPICNSGQLRGSLLVEEAVEAVEVRDDEGNVLGFVDEVRTRTVQPEGSVVVCDGCSAAVELEDESQLAEVRQKAEERVEAREEKLNERAERARARVAAKAEKQEDPS